MRSATVDELIEAIEVPLVVLSKQSLEPLYTNRRFRALCAGGCPMESLKEEWREALESSVGSRLSGTAEVTSVELLWGCAGARVVRWVRAKETEIGGKGAYVVMDPSPRKHEPFDTAGPLSSLRSLAHELRGPLDAILGFADLLQRNPSPSTNTSGKEWMGGLVSASRHLLAALAVVEKHESVDAVGRADISALNLRSVVAESIRQAVPLAQRHYVTVAPRFDNGPEEIMVLGCPVKIRQVMTNLLSNAIKYSSRGGSVYIDLFQGDDSSSVTVTDRGVGMGVAELREIFARHHRTSHTKLDSRGDGIGLVLSKRMVEGMGGSLLISSLQCHGTSAELRLRTPLTGATNRIIERGAVPMDTDIFARHVS